MTWKSFHHREEVLRTVITTADTRRDGILPLDVAGVADTFGDELGLLGALQLRWHTRLSGNIESQLGGQGPDPEEAVVTAWRRTAEELPGVRAILDHYRSAPLDPTMAEAMATATAKERVLLAVMAGQTASHDPTAAQAGAVLEQQARAAFRPFRQFRRVPARPGVLDRIRAALVA
jgi:hypothetical protein